MSEDTPAKTNPINMLAPALSAMQAKYTTVTHNATVDTGKFKYTYATLDHILDEMRPLMAAHGFAVTNRVDQLNLVITLMHESGQCISSVIPLHNSADPKAFGSELTYMRRYGITGLLGLATDDDDDGGRANNYAREAAKPKPKPRKPKPQGPDDSSGGQDKLVQRIWIHLRQTESTMQHYVDDSWSGEDWLRKRIKEAYGAESTKALEPSQANELIQVLKKLETDNKPPGE
jgi:hypothetical protein